MSRPRGPGETQPERTALAWQRTGLGLLAVAALLARGAVVAADPLLVLPAGAVAVAGLAVLGVLAPGRRRAAELAAGSGSSAAAGRPAGVVTALVVLAALSGLAAELLR